MIRLGIIQENIIVAAREGLDGTFYIARLPTLNSFFSGWDEAEVQPSIDRMVKRGLLAKRSTGIYQLAEKLMPKKTMQQKVCEIYGLPSELAD